MFLPFRLCPIRGVLAALAMVIFGSSSSFAQRPLGTDVSGYQTSINWTTVKNAGVVFAWSKATEGTGFTSSYYSGQVTGAVGAGIYIGAYHYARPSLNPNITGASSADSEAAYFWGVAGPNIKANGTNLVPMLDWEDVYVTNTTLNATSLTAWANEWCLAVSNYARGNGVYDLRPVVYTGTWFSHSSTYNGGLTTGITNWPDWISSYPTGPNPQTGSPNVGNGSPYYPWTYWYIWQYADTNWSGGDADVFNGTTNQFITAFVIGAASAPTIVTQPSSRTVDRGASIVMKASATGAGTVTYQWRLNGVNISGATATNYTLSNIQTSQAGSYMLVAANASGTATSSPAILTVNPIYNTVFSDNFDVNSSANWTLSTSSTTNNRATFAYDYSGIGIPSAPNSTNGTTKGLRFEANLSATNVAALNASPNGQHFGGDYRLHFDMWINVNGPLPGGGNGSTEEVTAGIGTAGGHVQWSGSGINTNADGVWFTVDGDGGVATNSTTQGDFMAYNGTNPLAAAAGNYCDTSALARTWADTNYANVFPGGQTPPAYQVSTYAQQTGALKVGTVGLAWRDVVVNKTGNVITYFIDGLQIASVTNATLSASNIFVGYWDPFSSVSDNTNLSFGIIDNVKVETPITAPSISSQPQSLTVFPTSNAVFSVTASGTSVVYQWQYNGGNISGATLSSYTKTNVQTNDAGSYSVILTNLSLSVTSSPAILTVVVPPAFTTPLTGVTNLLGSTVSLAAQVTGSQLVYQWLLNGTNLPNGATGHGSTVAGVTTSNLTITSSVSADSGSYTLVITNIGGTASNTALVSITNIPPTITTQPNPVSVGAGTNAVYTTTPATGTPTLTYQWRRGTTALTGSPHLIGATGLALTVKNASHADEDSYNVVVTGPGGTATSANATLSVYDAPTVTSITGNQTNVAGSSVVYTVITPGTSPGYQWKKSGTVLSDGANISGALTASLTLLNISAGSAGSYTVTITNIAGSANGGPSTLTVSAGLPPTIPGISLVVTNGTNLNVAASFTGSVGTFQWSANGVNLTDNGTHIIGATTTNLTIQNATSADAGTYTLIATNAMGSATNSAIFTAPQVTVPPTGITANVGSSAAFNVTAVGTPPLSYQWLLNSATASGATNAALSLSNLQPGQAGSYAVVVSSLAGSITSSNAILQLINLQFARSTLLPDGTIQLNLNGAPGSNYLLEATTDLLAPWTPVTALSNAGGLFYYIDTTATNQPQRFFRLSAPK